VLDAGGELRELVEIRDLALDRRPCLGGQGLRRTIVAPFFRRLIERLVVLLERPLVSFS
jgi:hypothetical protein